jgi:hypothetical protein
VGERLVLARIEGQAERLDRRDPLRLEQHAQLAVDGRDALHPAVGGERLGHGLDGPVEVVGDGDDLAQERLVGQAGRGLPLLLGAALVVLEVGRDALQASQVLRRLLDGVVALALQVRHLLHELGDAGCLERLDALLGSGLVGRHASPQW